MGLEHLWAGWRSDYVSSVTTSQREEAPEATAEDTESTEGTCVFCSIITSSEPDEAVGLVYRVKTSVVILNAYPYTSGHLLVLPTRHVAGLDELGDDESQELWDTTRAAVTAVRRAYDADGINFGANLGRAAGAGLPGHLHLHVLPRWIGDTNFMTTVAGVRVMPETLHDSWVKLRASWPLA